MMTNEEWHISAHHSDDVICKEQIHQETETGEGTNKPQYHCDDLEASRFEEQHKDTINHPEKRAPRTIISGICTRSNTTAEVSFQPLHDHLYQRKKTSHNNHNHFHKHKRPIGLGHATGIADSIRIQAQYQSTDEVEDNARSKAETRPWVISVISFYAALKVFCFKLITIDSVLSCGLSIALTTWIYYAVVDSRENRDVAAAWSGGMDWVLLGFAVITPISVAISIAFTRRERALIEIANFRSFSFQLYLVHTMWDWDTPPKGRASANNMNWLNHGDEVLTNLVGIADELFRFLTLPTCSRSRHRVTYRGRQEAARTVEAAYRLLDSCVTRRFILLAKLGETLKSVGFPSGEASRLRQYERFMNGNIEQLRMIKMYRSPQALRAFARLFSVVVPPLYAPYFADLSLRVNSLALGIIFAILTALALTALTETVENLEDPFVGYLTLDGISKCNNDRFPLDSTDWMHVAKLVHSHLIHTIVFVFSFVWVFHSCHRCERGVECSSLAPVGQCEKNGVSKCTTISKRASPRDSISSTN
jgi:hypothetical protein